MIDAHLNTELPLPPGAAEAIAQARRDMLAGRPGNLQFEVTVTRKDGRVETHHLIGRVSPSTPEDASC